MGSFNLSSHEEIHSSIETGAGREFQSVLACEQIRQSRNCSIVTSSFNLLACARGYLNISVSSNSLLKFQSARVREGLPVVVKLLLEKFQSVLSCEETFSFL
jgi:hypothetical protein